MQALSRLRLTRAELLILFGNALPVVGYFFFGWSIDWVYESYWLEAIVMIIALGF